MATKPKHPFIKARDRAVRLQARLMFRPDLTDRDFDTVNRAWEQAARLHRTYAECQGEGLCEWCDRFPELDFG